MPSPFPGMDPYIEAYGDWLDFHGAFMAYCRDFLNERLPTGYVASLDSQLKLVLADDVVEGRMRPDVGVHRDPRIPRAGGTGRTETATATLEPETLTLPVDYDEVRESWVQIIKYPEQELVAHIELLSPTNKHEPGLGEYQAKRIALIHQQKVNMVEIDLLLKGPRLETIEPLPQGDYYAFISRADRRPKVDVYSWSVQHVLPTIPIPLLPPDPDVPLDLALLANQVYDRGRYGMLLRYDRELPPQLREEDLTWARGIAQSARK